MTDNVIEGIVNAVAIANWGLQPTDNEAWRLFVTTMITAGAGVRVSATCRVLCRLVRILYFPIYRDSLVLDNTKQRTGCTNYCVYADNKVHAMEVFHGTRTYFTLVFNEIQFEKVLIDRHMRDGTPWVLEEQYILYIPGGSCTWESYINDFDNHFGFRLKTFERRINVSPRVFASTCARIVDALFDGEFRNYSSRQYVPHLRRRYYPWELDNFGAEPYEYWSTCNTAKEGRSEWFPSLKN